MGEAGAGIYCEDASPTIIDCQFIGCSAKWGGGITMKKCPAPTVTGCTFTDCSAREDGGAIEINLSSPVISRCFFLDCSSLRWGGALNITGGAPACDHLTFYGSTCPTGACVYTSAMPAATFDRAIFSFGYAGAAIACDNGLSMPDFYCCDIYGNAGGPGMVGDQFDAGNPFFNLTEDPEYCDPDLGIYNFSKSSPCYNQDCGAMGALRVYPFCMQMVPPGFSAPLAISEAAESCMHLGAGATADGLTDIRFRLTDDARITVRICDVDGRRIRTLATQMFARGEQHLVWDGRNDAGERVARGIYLYQLGVGTSIYSGRAVLLR